MDHKQTLLKSFYALSRQYGDRRTHHVWHRRIFNQVHHRANLSFLGVHRPTLVLAISGDMGWEPPKLRLKYEMSPLWNRLLHMPEQGTLFAM